MSRIERELSIKGEQASAQAARQVNADIRTVLSSIRDIVVIIQKIKTRASAKAKREELTRATSVIEVTSKLLDKPGAVKHIALPNSNPAVPKEAAMPMSAEERAVILQRWQDAIARVEKSHASMTPEEGKQVYQELAQARRELGDIGLSAGLINLNLEKVSKTFNQQKAPSVALVRNRPNESPDRIEDEHTTEEGREAERQAFLSPEQQTVIKTTQTLIGTGGYDAYSDETTTPGLLKYRAEEFNIYEAGDQVTITDKENNVLFVYAFDSETGQAMVIKDSITQDVEIQKQFDHAAQSLRQAALSSIKQDSTGILQMRTLGGLAPEGARSTAIAAMVTREEKVVVSKGIRYQRVSDRAFDVTRENAPPGESVISTASPERGIQGEYTPEERIYFKKAYQAVAAEYTKQQSQSAANRIQDREKLVIKRDQGDRER